MYAAVTDGDGLYEPQGASIYGRDVFMKDFNKISFFKARGAYFKQRRDLIIRDYSQFMLPSGQVGSPLVYCSS